MSSPWRDKLCDEVAWYSVSLHPTLSIGHPLFRLVLPPAHSYSPPFSYRLPDPLYFQVSAVAASALIAATTVATNRAAHIATFGPCTPFTHLLPAPSCSPVPAKPLCAALLPLCYPRHCHELTPQLSSSRLQERSVLFLQVVQARAQAGEAGIYHGIRQAEAHQVTAGGRQRGRKVR